MKFINKGKPVQVRISDGGDKYKWELLNTGECIELSKDVGKSYGFEKVTEGKAGPKKVETKQLEEKKIDKKKDKDFLKQIQKIKGIGRKTAEDIISVYSTKEDLVNAIKKEDKIPFRDDIVEKLREEYGE